jgi:hypothetical protein
VAGAGSAAVAEADTTGVGFAAGAAGETVAAAGGGFVAAPGTKAAALLLRLRAGGADGGAAVGFSNPGGGASGFLAAICKGKRKTDVSSAGQKETGDLKNGLSGPKNRNHVSDLLYCH